MNYNILKHSDFINHSLKFLVLLIIQKQKKTISNSKPERNSLQLWQFGDPGGIYCCFWYIQIQCPHKYLYYICIEVYDKDKYA